MKPDNPLHDTQVTEAYRAIIAIATIFVVIFLLVSMSLYFQGNLGAILSSPSRWFSDLDTAIAFDILSTSAELLAAVLAIAITVVAIVVELAANRYSHRITTLFVRERINIYVMTFLVIATVYSIWIALTLDAQDEGGLLSSVGLLTSMTMVTISLIILLPYFAFVMSFLSPVNIITKIERSALESVERIGVVPLELSKFKLLNAVDDLQDISRRSMELSDRAVEMASINSLYNIIVIYQRLISGIGAESEKWFQVEGSVKSDLDFVSINSASLKHIESKRLWVEVKILRQYLDMVSDSNPSSRDISYLIAINTKKIAVESVQWRPGLELAHLCIRCFNSYLRATINNRDARTGYYIMNQYRMLAESLLSTGEQEAVKSIALHLQFYGILGFKQKLPFLLEVAAEDVAQLAVGCSPDSPKLLDRLVELLLDLDQEIREEYQEDSLLGVRRAQLKLAAYLLECNDEPRAFLICDDLKDEKPERIEQLIELLTEENRNEYWEFTDRGVNFAYIDEELRRHLPALRERINKSATTSSKKS